MSDYDKITLILWGVCGLLGYYMARVRKVTNKEVNEK